MKSSASLRPGVILGHYPQKASCENSRLDRIASQIEGSLRQLVPELKEKRFESFISLVDCHSEPLTAMNDDQLATVCRELKESLSASGLTDDSTAHCFALIREVAERTLGLRHFNTQLMGGWAMIKGKIAEMQTGEGKTLTATLPACTAALSGIPVHIITVNDYLAQRDSEWMGPIYKKLGLSVGLISEGLTPEQRRSAYECDVTYCTNKQLVFDYLKDRIVMGHNSGHLRYELDDLCNDGKQQGNVLLRGLCFAIVDEADSVLVDEAKTPLIISKQTDNHKESHIYEQALEMAAELEPTEDFKLIDQERAIELTKNGKAKLDSFGDTLGGLWRGKKRRENIVRQALSALNYFIKDTHYLVKDGKVLIIDEYTGRVMPDRSWEQGLHQLIEAKEGCPISSQPETLARISYQRFFRRYLHLAGMTGTAKEITGELWAVYGLGTMVIPSNKPQIRKNMGWRVYVNNDLKNNAILTRIYQMRTEGRPVLVGTRSVAASENLSELLQELDIPHKVLNARQDLNEAEIIAQAGMKGRVTVATNMAGRGTDIHLEEGVVDLGGLHVIATEQHEASRIDRQLFGRSARQGDPGSYEYILSLEDEIVTKFSPKWIWSLQSHTASPKSHFRKISVLISQKIAEYRHAQVRKELLRIDEHLGNMLSYSGQQE